MHQFFYTKLLIIIMVAYMSNSNIDFTKYYLEDIDIGNIQQITDNSNQSMEYNFNNTEIDSFNIYPYTSDSWGDISNNSYVAKYYRANVDKNKKIDTEKLETYTKKVWVNDSNTDIKYSLIITNIKDNIISGNFQIGERALLNNYNYAYEISGNGVENLAGLINNEGAKCKFSGLDKGKINLTFIDDLTIKLDIDTIYSTKYKKITNKTYYLKPYYRQLKDIPLTEENFYTVNLNSWGLVNITTGYITGSHSYAVAYITNSNREILYEFSNFINGVKIKDVVIEDINNDGLKDINLIFDTGKDSPVKYNYIQIKNGMFVRKS